MVITIDGPAGSGKSTVARRLARQLNLQYVDTGASYRAAAWLTISKKLDLANDAAVIKLVQSMEYAPGPLMADMCQRIWVNGTEVTAAIRTPAVAEATSQLATNPAVRQILVDIQRKLAAGAANGAVLEGRDTGTVVCPDAGLKVFLVASPQERARRRAAEMSAAGREEDEQTVLEQLAKRDKRDSTRAASPLAPAPGAHIIDTDNKGIDEVVNEILAMLPAGMLVCL